MSKPSSTVSDHFNSPRNAGPMESPDVIGRASLDGRAPRVAIYLKARGNVIAEASFEAFGCGYSIAACSCLTELATGQTLDACQLISAEVLIAELAGMPQEKEFCAQLAVDALQDGVLKITERGL